MPATLAQSVTLKPLAPQIGVEISGIDLAAAMSDATFATIESAWHRHGIFLVRGQQLDETEQFNFARRFGPIAQVINKHDGGSKAHPGVMYVSNVREGGKLVGVLPDGEMFFHSDQCYIEQPAMASMLYAMEIPSTGGNTLFANMYAAYDALPEDLKRALDGKRAMHVYDYGGNPTKRGVTAPDSPRAAHPIFRTHPATGRRALYVNRLMTEHIVGMDRAESDAILGELFDHQENPAWIYEHRWTPGDFLMWDNRCTLHARTDFDASERRRLRRCVVLGEKPY